MKITKEAKLFYAMCAQLKSSVNFMDFLVDAPTKVVAGSLKRELKLLSTRITVFIGTLTNGLPKEDADLWLKEWERDFDSCSSIFMCWADMNDEQRGILEDVAEQIHKGNVQAQQGYTSVAKAELVHLKQYVVITNDTLLLCTYHNDTYDEHFTAISPEGYDIIIRLGNVRAVRPFNIEDELKGVEL